MGDTITTHEEIIDDLHELRAIYGMLGADYRQGRVDVAIENLEALQEERFLVASVGRWEEAIGKVEENAVEE